MKQKNFLLGVSRLMDLLADNREVVRNDVSLLIPSLTVFFLKSFVMVNSPYSKWIIVKCQHSTKEQKQVFCIDDTPYEFMKH